MDAKVYKLAVPAEKTAKITKWKVRQGSHISKGVLLALYKTEEQENDSVAHKLKASNAGIVKKILVKEGQLFPPGSDVIEIGSLSTTICSHPTVMKDMCAECGADLRCELGLAGERKEAVQASVAMVHCIPELIVSEEVALELGKADEHRLLSSRKLALLVDLDQTLIHTTNDSIPNKLKDVYHFQLWHGRKLLWYHTKFRPGTKQFLETISELYELHICTFGVRMYAHTIARFIDPDGKYFSHRILSRDECFDAMSKTANLKALFPCGDCMAAIIDDREDVWNFAPNLVHVKPYHFFQGTADINAPPGLTKTENDNVLVSHEIKRSLSTEDASKNTETKIEIDEKENTSPKTESEKMTVNKSDLDDVEMKDADISDKSNEDNKINSNSDSDDTNLKGCNSSDNSDKNSLDNKTKPELKSQVSEEEEEIEWVDDDDYLIYLTDILTRIHKAYYDVYDQMIDKDNITELPNIKNIIPYVKRKVLKNVNIVFSGVVPLNIPPEKCRAYAIAKSLGANIQPSMISYKDNPEEATTHLIASKPGTAKYRLAVKLKKVKIVNLEWLMCCSNRWEWVDERLFPVLDDSSMIACDSPVAELENFKKKLGKKYKRKSDDSDPTDEDLSSSKKSRSVEDNASTSQTTKVEFANSVNPLYFFSDEDIECMDKEVENLLDEDEGASDEDEEDRDSRMRTQVLSDAPDNSSTDDSLEGNFPKGWKKKSKSIEVLCEKEKEGEDSEAPVPDEDSENELDKYQKNVEAFSPDSDKSDSDKDSIGSVDDEIADAVEKEFLSML